jgi:hypothetical protein
MTGYRFGPAARYTIRRGSLLCCSVSLLALVPPSTVHAQDAGLSPEVVAPSPAPAAAPARPVPADPLIQRGWRLRAEIDATYQQLRATKTLTRRVDQPNDVTALVLKYIPAGTSFDNAAAILRAANCEIGVNAQGHGYATLPMKDGLLQQKHTLKIELVPRTANEFTVIGDVRGFVVLNYRYNSDLK